VREACGSNGFRGKTARRWVASGTLALEEWGEALRVLQACEDYGSSTGAWVEPGAAAGFRRLTFASRFQLAATINPAQ